MISQQNCWSNRFPRDFNPYGYLFLSIQTVERQTLGEHNSSIWLPFRGRARQLLETWHRLQHPSENKVKCGARKKSAWAASLWGKWNHISTKCWVWIIGSCTGMWSLCRTRFPDRFSPSPSLMHHVWPPDTVMTQVTAQRRSLSARRSADKHDDHSDRLSFCSNLIYVYCKNTVFDVKVQCDTAIIAFLNDCKFTTINCNVTNYYPSCIAK